MESYVLAVLCQTGLFATAGSVSGWLLRSLGLTSLAGGAFLGSGAYCFAILVRGGVWPPAALVASGVLGAVLGCLLVSSRTRVVAVDFALVSFCAQVAWHGLVSNADGVTGGALGLASVATIRLGGLSRLYSTLLLVAASFGITALLVRLATQNWFAVGASIVRRSTELADTLGIPRRRIELQAGILYGGCLGVCGAVISSYLSFVDPTGFDSGSSVTLLALAFMGENGPRGAVIGSALLGGIPEVLRLVGLPVSSAAYLRVTIAGVVTVAAALSFKRRLPS